jgi:uncharacterized protein YuzE
MNWLTKNWLVHLEYSRDGSMISLEIFNAPTNRVRTISSASKRENG